VEIWAGDAEDRRIGRDLREYAFAGCPQPGSKPETPKKLRESPEHRAALTLCASVSAIEVNDRRVTIHSDFENDPTGRAFGEVLCSEIQGSDVADFTPGHEVQSKDGETITVCPNPNG